MKVSDMMRELAMMDFNADVVVRISDASERDGAIPHDFTILRIEPTFDEPLGVEVWVELRDEPNDDDIR